MKLTEFLCLAILGHHTAVQAAVPFPGSAVSWGPDRIDLFGKESGSYGFNIWHKSYDSAKNSWKTESLNMSSSFNSRPIALTRGKDRLDVFTTASGIMYQTWNGKQWLPEEGDSGDEAFLSEDGVGVPAVASWDSDRVDVIVRLNEGGYGRKSFNGSAWVPSGQAVEDLGMEGFNNRYFTSDPACVSWDKNSLDVFGILSNGTLLHKYWNGEEWKPSSQGWQNWGDGFWSLGPLVVVSRAKKTLEVFAPKQLGRGSAIETWYNKWDSSKHLAFDNLGPGTSAPEKYGDTLLAPTITHWDGRIDLFNVIPWTRGTVFGRHKWFEGGKWNPANDTEDGDNYAWWDDHNVTTSSLTGLTSVSLAKDNLNLFFIDTDQNVRWQKWDGKAWSPPDGDSHKVEDTKPSYMDRPRKMLRKLEKAYRKAANGGRRRQPETVKPLVVQDSEEKLGL